MSSRRAIVGVLVFGVTAVFGANHVHATHTESIPVDSPRWKLEGKAGPAEYLGRRCLSLEDGRASLRDFQITDDVIDVDMAGKGVRGFYSIYFRTEGDSGEVVYLRPHKTGLDDAQQYAPIVNGLAPWQIYAGAGFTKAVEIPKDAWFHVRLEMQGAQVRLSVDDMSQPSLIVNDLKSGIRKGGVAFDGTCVSNVEIRETPPVAWERHEPVTPQTTITKWRLSPSLDAMSRALERPISTADAASRTWQDVTAEAPGFVLIDRYRRSPNILSTFARDFSRRLDPQKGMQVVYARTTIVSDRDQFKKLSVGYCDDVSVFLNGAILYRGRSAQRFRDPGFLGVVNPDNDAVYLPLKKGPNELMLAVSELTGGWGFICRFDDMDGVH
jgi:hypothetical protein